MKKRSIVGAVFSDIVHCIVATFLAVIASALNLISYGWYLRDLVRGNTRPNIASWTIWLGVTAISVASYAAATGDLVKSLLSWSILLANIIIFSVLVRRARWANLSRIDIAALVIGLVAAIAWLFTHSAWWGNLLIQLAIIAGGVPTYVSVWQNPNNERPGPWLLWGVAFICQILVIITKWAGQPLELVYPIIGAILYGGIGIVARKRSIATGSMIH